MKSSRKLPSDQAAMTRTFTLKRWGI
jgi:hypothetical protein